ncbi:MAG TPA: HAD-IA family hydrolase [Kofleriaceae bacterium]|nr:HAD-IA family hydrolase [Kofleriaceae bacterium]
MLTAALFDLDGTLIDTNDMHTRAWLEALAACGYRVAADRIAVEMGKGGDQLVRDLLGQGAEREDGDALRDAHDAAFARLAEREGIVSMPGSRALLEALRARGIKLALATSSGQDALALVERTSGTAWRELVDVVTNADDVEHSKPAPDIIHAAVSKLALTPAECAMFGDTPWDAHAAKRAGVALVGLRCGGNEDRALLGAGARMMYQDPAAVIAALDDVLRRVSPSRRRLDRATLDELMEHALAAATAGLARSEVPIGCAIADGDGEVIATGYNRRNQSGDRTLHAEIDAFRTAGHRLPERDAILVSTLEPCVMCLGAAMETAVDAVLYAIPASEDGGTIRVAPPQSADNQMPRIVGGILADQSRALFTQWLTRPDRNRAQERFVRALLGDPSAS